MPRRAASISQDPLWYKDAIIYELHVKSFADSNDDGIGDFEGLLEKLDYLESLGITAIWLLPFYPSPLRDDGYDISDYFSINPEYGTLKDFRRFVREAHKRGIRVITELVVNHTSDAHPWFQRSRRSRPGSVWRDFYVWSDTPDRYSEARVIFQDFERSNWTWDPVAEAYYWHRFYSHQPDLNFDNPRVKKEIFRIMDSWFKAGVDGVRLDAVPYLFEREGTNCENLEETHGFLRELRAHMDRKFPGRFLLAEANQWPEDAAKYFGSGDECNMTFHFPVMPRLFMAVQMEERFPIVDILEQTPEIPDTCQWAMFLRNHDELTLEMVTDEERDYMYRVYAQDRRMRVNLGIRRRLAPLLNNDRRTMELMNILLLSLPGTPVLYYGDEIGMGDNYYLGDRDGVRTPMQWSPDRNAGFSRTNPHRLYLPVIMDSEYHYAAINVENQERNPSSLLWWMRRALATRKAYKAFGRGSMQLLACENTKVLAFLRQYEEENILVLANLSGSHQATRIDLSDFKGHLPEEIFSGNRFPRIDENPYVFTLGPREFYWFQLRYEKEAAEAVGEPKVPDLEERLAVGDVQQGGQNRLLESALRKFIRECRWFAGKGRSLRRVRVRRRRPMKKSSAVMLLVEAIYAEGPSDHYLVPVAWSDEETAAAMLEQHPTAWIAHVDIGGQRGVLFDAVCDPAFRGELLEIIARRNRHPRREIVGDRSSVFQQLLGDGELPETSDVLKAEQSNTSIVYGETFFLKLYRRIEPGVNPDLEITRFLTERTDFRNIPVYAGSLAWAGDGGEPLILGILQARVPNQGDAWTTTRDAVDRFYDRALAKHKEAPEQMQELPADLLDITTETIPTALSDLIGAAYLEKAQLLGQRTAEFHVAMASAVGDKDFEPEVFTKLYQRSVYQGMWGLLRKVMRGLKSNLSSLPEELQPMGRAVLDAESKIVAAEQKITNAKMDALKLRIHGDYHLGQVLYTGKDFVLIDFEGEPARPLSERRLKRSPLRDVAGMIRSFHYAAYATIVLGTASRVGEQQSLEYWASLWYRAVSGVFLNAYIEAIGETPIVPADRKSFKTLMQAFLLDKAIYELGYELNNRPDWLRIPLSIIPQVLKESI